MFTQKVVHRCSQHIADKSLKMETVLIHQLMNGHKNVIEPHTVECYLALKIQVLAHAIAWMNPENSLLIQPVTEDHIVYDPIYKNFQKSKIYRQKVAQWLP